VHFERGITAYKEGRFKDAIDAFLDAHEQYPSPVLSYNMARAYEKMGDSAGALRFYREYLRQSPTASDRATVEQRIAELEKKLEARGIQQVTIFSKPEAATVVLDGRPVGVTPWTGEIAPGSHAVTLRREGYQDGNGVIELAAGKALDYSLELKPKPASATAPVDTAPPAGTSAPPDSGPTESGGIGIGTWTAFGVGAAALGGALAFELMRAGAEDDVKNEPTQLARADAFDRMESRQTTARVLAGVGAVAVLAGGVLLYFDLSKSDDSAAARVGLGCGGDGCGASLKGRF
jgi:tetratricopeptide (TPR) repeat protein